MNQIRKRLNESIVQMMKQKLGDDKSQRTQMT